MEYQTSTLNLAGTLSLFFPIIRIEYKGKQGTFFFEDSPELQQTAKAYWDDTLSVPPQKLLVAVKQLKSRVFERGR